MLLLLRKRLAMIITEMKWKECVDFLSSQRLARLACAKDNWAYIVPIHYAFVGNWFYGFSLPGQKVEWMRDNPHVCIEVDELREHRCWVSVVSRGTYQELPDTEEWHDERMHAGRPWNATTTGGSRGDQSRNPGKSKVRPLQCSFGWSCRN
ncbi:pyridoxamine 5'-phosphate oxidase family protein [Rhizobium sp. P32RR-XVIII]|uniref:pyridoxamine 5'-phosphate oxidase family protein n=1 Tax=Rhizobium sp. P32RR-XVIII TaxID=2726738 RepID=UPI0028B18FFD|nr:pyridoxamine 5'-phosphate oxidase family protein [Rhizobium sp. P32RR-XVIII]